MAFLKVKIQLQGTDFFLMCLNKKKGFDCYLFKSPAKYLDGLKKHMVVLGMSIKPTVYIWATK